MRKHRAEIDEFMKEIQDRTPLGAKALVDNFSSFTLPLHQSFFRNNRLHDADPMSLQQRFSLPANRRQRTVLNLDQFVSANDIVALTAQLHFVFGTITRIGIF